MRSRSRRNEVDSVPTTASTRKISCTLVWEFEHIRQRKDTNVFRSEATLSMDTLSVLFNLALIFRLNRIFSNHSSKINLATR